MENASKALLMAGGVLIAILVASLGVYFSRTMSDDIAEYYKKLEDNKRTEFNQQFLNFNDTSINIQDIVTIINLAKDSNKENDLEEMTSPTDPFHDNSLYVKVKFDNAYNLGGLSTEAYDKLEKLSNENTNQLIKNEMSKNNMQYFNCKVYVNSNTGYVNYIVIN